MGPASNPAKPKPLLTESICGRIAITLANGFIFQ